MRDSEVCKSFLELPIQELRTEQLAHGRGAVQDDVRKKWADIHKNALDVIADDRRSHRATALAQFVKVITTSLARLPRQGMRPTYYTYTDVAILDWFCNRDRPTYMEVRVSSLTGILYLLEDVARFESESLYGFEKRFAKSFDREVSAERLKLITNVVTLWEEGATMMSAKPIEELRRRVPCVTVGEYVDDPDRRAALIDFSCFPQTEFHDEYLFLRTIHMSELAFTGIGSGIQEAIECLKMRDYGGAVFALNHVVSFAHILHQIFKVLYTMPTLHFADFREATGDASAVQSQSYQLLEIFCFGMNEQKIDTFRRFGYLDVLGLYRHPQFMPLKSILREVMNDPAAGRVIDRARAFDSKLLQWRGLHLGFAYKYLPPETIGTGGTSGASYLERFLKQTLFPDTTFEAKKLHEQFPDFADVLEKISGYKPTATIAPSDDQ